MHPDEYELLKTIDRILSTRSPLLGVHLFADPPCVHQSTLSRDVGLAAVKDLLCRLRDRDLIAEHPDFDGAYSIAPAGRAYLIGTDSEEYLIKEGSAAATSLAPETPSPSHLVRIQNVSPRRRTMSVRQNKSPSEIDIIAISRPRSIEAAPQEARS